MADGPHVLGVVPAAGTGSRLGDIGRLKELLPVWPGEGDAGPACGCLLSAFAAADIERVTVVIRAGKEEIEVALGASAFGVRLEYLVADRLDGPPYTVDRAFPGAAGSVVAIGFPDILFDASDAFRVLLRRLRTEPFDAVLGMFPTFEGQRADRVVVDAGGRVSRVEPRAGANDPGPTWALAVWSPRFSAWMHELLVTRAPADIGQPEPVFGDVFNAAISDGIAMGAAFVSDSPFLDIGTPAGLDAAYRHLEREGIRP